MKILYNYQCIECGRITIRYFFKEAFCEMCSGKLELLSKFYSHEQQVNHLSNMR